MREIGLLVAAMSLSACVTFPGTVDPARGPETAAAPPGQSTPAGQVSRVDPIAPAVGSEGAPVSDAPSREVSPRNDLWTAVRRDLRLPSTADRPEVRDALRAYQRDRDIGRVFLGRGQTLMPMVVAEARALGVPVELAFLPFVESKLNPTASNAGNVGMWQFQAATARLMGLQTGPGIDERKDPVRATRAAYSYLLRLHQVFDGDWMLALTAYNIGDGRLKQLIAASGTRDVWRLPLPAHCRVHIARLAALWEIARNPDAAGVRLPPLREDFRVERITVDQSSSLVELASVHGVDRDALALLNAHLGSSSPRAGSSLWLPRWDTRDSGTPRSVPDQTGALAAGGSRAAGGSGAAGGSRAAAGARYRVKSGDSLYSIARRFNTSVDRLKAVNGLTGDALRIGIELQVGGDTP